MRDIMSIHWLGHLGTALCIAAYCPQILHLIKERCSAGLSVRAYGMWIASAFLLLSYAVAMGNAVFVVLQSYQLGAAALICVFCKKYEGRLCEDHGSGAGRSRISSRVRPSASSVSTSPGLLV